MAHALYDLVKHNQWATDTLLTFCEGLDDETLNTTRPGTYGTIIETLRHFIDSESSYLYRLAELSERPWQAGEAVGLNVLKQRADQLVVIWERLLNNDDVDTERMGEAFGDDDEVFAVRAGIFLTQALHHANEHRAQICSILGALGQEPPDVSAWGYALATGRMTLKETPGSA